ncbi:UDP-glucuronosyltransferase 2B7-like [Photinus pyralis]|nr:UDP-glucuronosyltransferase 2B7-like [Photinus pyralis]
MLIVFLLTFLLQYASCANILYVAPIASPSLQRWNRALAMGLRNRGHNVTMLSHDAEKGPPIQNFTLILLEGIYDILDSKFVSNEIKEDTAIKTMKALFKHVEFCCEYDFNTTGFKTLQEYPKKFKFDLIIFDSSYGRCFYPLVTRFNNPPAVAVTPYRLPPILSNAFGNHLHTSYTPYYNTEFSTKMTFLERLLNFFYTFVEVMYRKNSFSPKENKLVKDYFGEETPALRDYERNMSLLLANVDFIFDFPMALPPNIIPVGGLHLTPSKPLPKDLQKIMDDSKNGVIYFSLGSFLRSDKLSATQKTNLLEAFKQLPQTVLWKYEGGSIEGLPKNVILRKTLPQNDILGHKNTKLFITHGGILSTQEAMYHAAPVVGIPFRSDQRANIRRMERRKTARLINYNNLTVTHILENVKEVLNNPIYKTNMKLVAKRYRDQPMTALQKGVYWIEYVLRHKNVDHLVLPARDMDGYQTANLDILACLLLLCLSIYIAYLFLPTAINVTYETLRNHIQAK